MNKLSYFTVIHITLTWRNFTKWATVPWNTTTRVIGSSTYTRCIIFTCITIAIIRWRRTICSWPTSIACTDVTVLNTGTVMSVTWGRQTRVKCWRKEKEYLLINPVLLCMKHGISYCEGENHRNCVINSDLVFIKGNGSCETIRITQLRLNIETYTWHNIGCHLNKVKDEFWTPQNKDVFIFKDNILTFAFVKWGTVYRHSGCIRRTLFTCSLSIFILVITNGTCAANLDPIWRICARTT
jgi:hypothetical protein